MEKHKILETVECYTANEVAKLTGYKTRRTLLQALRNNQNKNEGLRDLTVIWNARRRFGKTWVFKKEDIDLILFRFYKIL